jgi:AsmA protein
MSASAPPSRHLLRWIVLAIVVVLGALVVALAIYVHSLLQPQRFTTLLENDLAAAGLALDMQAPAEPALFPRPAVQLHAFSLTNIGSDTPVLRARGATIVVPWRALLRGEVAIERIDIDAPRMDLGELESLLGRLPHRAGPPHLPTIATGIHMSRGTLTRNGAPLLFDLSLETGALSPGEPFRLDASAQSSSGRRYVGSLTTVPSAAHDGVIEFDPLQIHVKEQGGAALVLGGHGNWRGGEALALQLNGTFRHRAPAPAAASTTAGAVADAGTAAGASTARAVPTVTDRITLAVSPAQGSTPMTASLKLDGNDAHVDVRLHPTEFGDWWNRLLSATPAHPPGPLPLTGTAQVQQLDLGWLKATDLQIDAGPDLAPASGATIAPAPASTAAAAAGR